MSVFCVHAAHLTENVVHVELTIGGEINFGRPARVQQCFLFSIASGNINVNILVLLTIIHSNEQYE